jgi:succinoglycan biosynthesis transport protein ExoP
MQPEQIPVRPSPVALATALNPHSAAAHSSNVELRDLYYVLFRHKWKIALGLILGLAGAAVLYTLDVPLYQSEAKLLVRYIISETKIAGPGAASGSSKIIADERGASIMATEKEILTSMDLARGVVEALGPQRILGRSATAADVGKAIEVLRSNLKINIAPGSSVIQILYGHSDPELVQPVVRELVDRYLKLHVATHRSSGMLSDTLAQEADTLRARLAQTEEELRRVTNRAGVVSLEAAKEAYNAQMISIRREILGYEAELAGRLAVLEELRKRISAANPANKDNPAGQELSTEPPLSTDILEQYRGLNQKLSRLQTMEQELGFQFTPENPRVKLVKAQIVEAETALRIFRERHPQLSSAVNTNVTNGKSADPAIDDAATAWIQITSYQAKTKELYSQYEKIRGDVAKLDQMEGQILELRRNKEIQEANYRYYAANFEQTRINETLGNGKVSNISQIQAPSPAFRGQFQTKKPAMALLGGIILGLGWAFLIEFYLDRSVRRPTDIPKLGSPLLLSIPRISASSVRKNLQLAENGAGDRGNSSSNKYSAYDGLDLRPFHETLRDKLIGFFESRNLTHKPKLIAVTGILNYAGVTTTAAGLARSLSETGDGNVLLVDMTATQGSAQQFIKGKVTCDLDQLLEARSQAHVKENLYVVAESEGSDRLSRNLPKRFANIIPKLKASDFDYIIFDMPKVNQLSITPRLSGFMDMVLLVVESEKTDRTLVQGACDLLGQSRTNVAIVLNKTRAYVPVSLQQDLASS